MRKELHADERRNEVRLQQTATVFVEVCSASFEQDVPADVIICSSVDISSNGILIEMDRPVAVGSILRLGADFGDRETTLYLVGEAKWLKEEQGNYMIGFELYDAEGTDIVSWKELIANQF